MSGIDRLVFDETAYPLHVNDADSMQMSLSIDGDSTLLGILKKICDEIDLDYDAIITSAT